MTFIRNLLFCMQIAVLLAPFARADGGDYLPQQSTYSSSDLLPHPVLKLHLTQAQRASLTPEQIGRVQEFVKRTQDRLPENLLPGIRGNVAVSFDLAPDKPVPVPRCQPSTENRVTESAEASSDNELGLTESSWNRYQIHLHSGFIPVILGGMENSAEFPCEHHNLYRLAEATLLHEAAHVYDRRTQVSSQSQFELITHRNNGSLETRYTGRSPDTYELTSNKEQFAVNFEYYMMDPEYPCRRPRFYRFYSTLFPGAQPAGSGAACSDEIRLTSQEDARDYVFRKNQVLGIDYLVAAPTTGAGRWGHSMLRIELCQERGANCKHVPGQDLVVSYNADIDESEMNILKGLFGGYASQQFVRSLANKRASDPMRALYSYPLKLSPNQIQEVVDAIAEDHWEYQGSYSFLYKNCVLETFNLLRSALDSEALNAEDIAGVTPEGLLSVLERHGLLDERTIAYADAHPLRSERAEAEQAFQRLRNAKIIPERIGSLDDFLSPDLSEETITPIYLRLEASHPLRALAEDFLVIHQLRVSALKAKRDALLAQWLSGSGASPKAQEYMDDIREQTNRLSPFSRARGGYGIPQESEGEIAPLEKIILSIYLKVFQDQDKVTALYRNFRPKESADIQSQLDLSDKIEKLVRHWAATGSSAAGK